MPVLALGLLTVMIGAGLLIYGLNRPAQTAVPPSNPVASTEPQPSTDPAICAVGDPSFRGSEPGDGRLHGGGLAMPKPTDWIFGAPDRLTWAFDVGLAEAPTETGWAALGAVRIEDPYGTPEQAAATIAGCLGAYADPGTLRVTTSKSVSVSGAERAHDYSGRLQTEGRLREFRVVVADVHSPESLACYVRLVDPESDQHRAVAAAEEELRAV